MPSKPFAFREVLLSLVMGMGLASLSPCLVSANTTPIEIRLNETVNVSHSLVTLADVAQIRTDDPALGRRIGQLDIAEIDEVAGSETVSQSQLELRLKLAGFSSADYTIAGASTITMTRVRQQISDEGVIEALREPLAAQWNVDASAVQIRLSRPLSTFIKSLPTHSRGRLEPFLRDRLLPGTLRISMGIYDGDRLIKTFAVSVDTSIRRRVAIAKSRLRPGHVIIADDFKIEQRDLSGRAALDLADVTAGRVVARWVQPGHPIRTPDLYSAGRAGSLRAQVVKRNSVVQLIARKKGLRVTVPGGVLIRDARVGESVPVRNPTSQKVVIGRLVSPSEVEVSF